MKCSTEVNVMVTIFLNLDQYLCIYIYIYPIHRTHDVMVNVDMVVKVYANSKIVS